MYVPEYVGRAEGRRSGMTTDNTARSLRDQVIALRDQWRWCADANKYLAARMSTRGAELYYSNGQSWAYQQCADQLDTLLATLTDEPPAGWREFVRHKPRCSASMCQKCMTLGHCEVFVANHEFTPFDCTCGLDTLLSSLKAPR